MPHNLHMLIHVNLVLLSILQMTHKRIRNLPVVLSMTEPSFKPDSVVHGDHLALLLYFLSADRQI